MHFCSNCVSISCSCQTLTRSASQENVNVIPIQYDPESPFKYNNFVYRISLPSPITSEHNVEDRPRQPGCVSIPDGTEELIVRLANPDAEGMNANTHIENEVAIITLASAALGAFEPHVVPSVYGWVVQLASLHKVGSSKS